MVSTEPAPADLAGKRLCRVRIELIPWATLDQSYMEKHRWVYTDVMIRNYQTSNDELLKLQPGKAHQDYVEVDVAPGLYSVYVVYVMDMLGARLTDRSNVLHLRKSTIDQRFAIDNTMIGKVVRIVYDPFKIKDFTATGMNTTRRL